jgi:2-hydroxychromene-2-carboxylate isomerase
MLQVEFFFDFGCPWSYLACTRVREAAMRTGASVVWRPFSLADLDPRQDTRAGRLDPDPGRAAWQLQDLEDWAHYCDLPLQIDSDWPRSYPRALAGAVHAAALGKGGAFVSRAFAALYADGRDIDDETVLREIAETSGLEPAEFQAALTSAEAGASVQANATELRSRGGFRSATLFVGEHMYCGSSRMPLVEFALAQASGRQFVMPGQHG